MWITTKTLIDDWILANYFEWQNNRHDKGWYIRKQRQRDAARRRAQGAVLAVETDAGANPGEHQSGPKGAI